ITCPIISPHAGHTKLSILVVLTVVNLNLLNNGYYVSKTMTLIIIITRLGKNVIFDNNERA
ncbi:hypothetical protein ACFLXC_07055, partial [Chloroflexota bacterium]